MRKWLMSCVFPGVDDVLAKPPCRVSMLISDDLPTLERPMKAYSGKLLLGHCATLALLHTNMADLIIIQQNYVKNMSFPSV
jgi:hypothetical protein